MDAILNELLATQLEGAVSSVLIGLHWTAVVVETADGQQCGLASTLNEDHYYHGKVDVPHAGQLEDLTGAELSGFVKHEASLLASIGAAALNALLPRQPQYWIEMNAEEVLAQYGGGKKVAIIGHFPFVDRLRRGVGELQVLEQDPRPGDLPDSAAVDILPEADVVAITGMCLINHSLAELLDLCSGNALVIMIGPTTPLSSVLFMHGVDILCGSVVASIEPVLKAVGQGGNFRQVRKAGVRTVTVYKPGLQLQR